MFFWSDILGTGGATLLFLVILLVPGYVCGVGLNLFGFRALNAGWQVIVSVALSFAVSPVVGFLLLRYGGMVPVWVALAVVLAVAGWMFSKYKPAGLQELPKPAIWICIAWVAIGAVMLADMQFGTKLYFSTTSFDHCFRVAVIDAITRTGLPPASPFNYIDGPVTMRYHVYWFGLCSIVQQLSGGLLPARYALNGSVIWCALGLMSLVSLATRFFQKTPQEKLLRRSLIGVGLLAVTGLDLIPNLLLALQHVVPPGDMEWWTGDQVTSWADAVLWVPHHIGGLVAGMTGVILLFDASENDRVKFASVAVSGLAFASATGCSIYVGFALAVVLSCWTLFTLIRKWTRHTIFLVGAGLAAVVFSVPNLLMLRGADTGGKFLEFSLHSSLHSEDILKSLGVADGPWFVLLQLPFLAADYFMELGLFFIIAIVMVTRFLKRRDFDRQHAAGLVMAGTALLLCSFVRSATISNNDLGWRGFMIVQFILLLWAAELLDAPLAGMKQPPKWVPAAFIALLIGAAGSIYQVTWLKVYDLIADTGFFGTEDFDTNTGARNYSLRVLYGKLDRMIPRNALVQSQPDTFADYWGGLYSGRQTVTTGEDCTVAMGGSLASCKKAMPELSSLFSGELTDPAEARKIVAKYHIRALVVMDDDDIWNSASGWTNKVKPAISERDARAYLF